jgi:periplasmic protein TonB
MATRAFLLCGDEKAVQAVTQILDELEVSFEHSSEPAFSLKRLATQRFDLLIVDCDNVQNATQVFNSARASNQNKTSIAIAIVEGKAGVPNAFRLGASLVLTKPVSLEQVRNTLRTGIGMTKKDMPEVKAPVSVPVAPPHGVAAPPTVTVAPPTGVLPPTPSSPTPIGPAPSATTVPVRPVVTPTVLTPVPPVSKPAPAPPVAAAPKPALSPTVPAEKPASVSTPAATVSEQKPTLTVLAPPKAEPTVGPSAFAKAASASAPASAPVKNFDSVFATPVLQEKLEKLPISKPGEIKSSSQEKTESSAPALSIVDPLAEEDVLDPTKDDGTPSFGGMGSQSFAGFEGETRSRGKGALIAAVVVLLLGVAGYAAWLTLPGFRKAISWQYLNAMSKISGTHGQPQTPSPERPIAPPPAEAATPAPNPENISTDSNATAAGNAIATAPSTATANPAAAGSATPESGNTASPENSKSATVQPGKQDTTHPATNAALVPTSASVPSTAAPKMAASDLLEVPEDFADDQVVHRVHPTYPKQAKAKKIHGTVVLQAIVNKQGKVDSLQLVSGDALLAQAAAEAVKQWRYKPYSHNGEPSDFQTRVTVDFKLP